MVGWNRWRQGTMTCCLCLEWCSQFLFVINMKELLWKAPHHLANGLENSCVWPRRKTWICETFGLFVCLKLESDQYPIQVSMVYPDWQQLHLALVSRALPQLLGNFLAQGVVGWTRTGTFCRFSITELLCSVGKWAKGRGVLPIPKMATMSQAGVKFSGLHTEFIKDVDATAQFSCGKKASLQHLWYGMQACKQGKTHPQFQEDSLSHQRGLLVSFFWGSHYQNTREEQVRDCLLQSAWHLWKAEGIHSDGTFWHHKGSRKSQFHTVMPRLSLLEFSIAHTSGAFASHLVQVPVRFLEVFVSVTFIFPTKVQHGTCSLVTVNRYFGFNFDSIRAPSSFFYMFSLQSL